MNEHAPIIRFFLYNTRMPFTTVFFDLDDTLYPASSGVWKIIKERMNVYMHERLGIDREAIPALREKLFREYGTTLRGLQAHYPVNTDEYLAYVHDIPLHEYLHPDPMLRAMLDSLPYRKLIFTNADAAHAQRTLAALGLENCFSAIVDIKAVSPYCKPMQAAFEIALGIAGEPDARCCVMLDDLPATIQAARKFGFYSILFGQEGTHPDADATLTRLIDLPEVLKGL
jgi:putative hydrolase of the HAD superfamily